MKIEMPMEIMKMIKQMKSHYCIILDILDLPMVIKFIMMIDLTITHKTVDLYKQKDQTMLGRVQVIILTANKILIMLKVTIRVMQKV
jgi:hypothetical protein